MICSLSGTVAREPVVSKTSGLIFEKSLVEQYIKENHRCPISGDDLSLEDLVVIKTPTSVPPRVSPSNVPSLLLSLQQEWESSVLETHALRMELDKTRKELAASLYKIDSAYRVISKLLKEKEELHKILNESQLNMKNFQSLSNQNNNVNANENLIEVIEKSKKVDDDVLEKLNSTYKALSGPRKGRKQSINLISKENIKNISLQKKLNFSSKITSLNSSTSFSNLFSQSNSNSNPIFLASFDDYSLALIDSQSGNLLSKSRGHSGYITATSFLPPTCSSSSLFFTASEDSTVKIWNLASNSYNFNNLYTFLHSSSVNDLTVHPSGSYLITALGNGSWSFLDIERRQTLRVVNPEEAGATFDSQNRGLTSINTHPDGLLVSTGDNNGNFNLFDLREQKCVSQMKLRDSSITSISFSENGYLCAYGDSNGQVDVIDLRKRISVQNFNYGNSPIAKVSFDYSGVYLGIAGGAKNEVSVKVVKDWTNSFTYADFNDSLTGFVWGEEASSFYVSSLDNTIGIYGLN